MERHAPHPETRNFIDQHRQGFRLFWQFKSRNQGGRPNLATESIRLIQQMAKENVLWGAERIRGELLKLEIKVATATIQKYLLSRTETSSDHESEIQMDTERGVL